MSFPMKFRSIIPGVAAALLLTCAIAQNSSQELPSAPSAVIQQQQEQQRAQQQAPPPAPAPAPAQQTAQPAEPQVSDGASSTAVPASDKPAETAAKATSSEQPAAVATGKGDDEPFTTIRVRADEVNVVFTVTDKHGHFVRDLKKSDFSILDDNKPPKDVFSFRAETDLPLRIGLLVDDSSSVRDRFKFEQEAAIEFLNQTVRPRSDQAFVLGFDTTAEVTQDFTDNPELLSHGVRMLRPGGGTALYDAVYYACRDKLMKAAPGQAVRRAIVLLTDGEDNQSRVTREEAIEMAQRAEVIIYAISTNNSGLKGTRGDKVLERMADATGGRVFFPFKIEDIANHFTEIQEELRSQYAISYRPADFVRDGRYRSIAIIADNKKYHVRSRRGYFTSKAQ
jgi:VWFA-related protein